MKQSVNFDMFLDSFSETYRGNFTYEGKRALFDWLEEQEWATGEETELDTIALCCDYTEYEDLKDFQHSYYGRDEKNPIINSMEKLEDYTQVIRVGDGDGFIISQF